MGSALVRVYLTPSGERELYTVSYWVDGKRKRQVFPSYDKAIAEAKDSRVPAEQGRLGGGGFVRQQRVACRRALELLEPTGVRDRGGSGGVCGAFYRGWPAGRHWPGG